MKRIIAVFLLLTFTFVACKQSDVMQTDSYSSSDIQANSIYADFLDTLKKSQTNLYYYIKDIDGNCVDDLIILENTKLSVYSYENSVELIGELDFFTGTIRFFCSESNNYPGIFCFTVGGGANHYGYMTIKNKAISFETLWDENYSDNQPDDISYITETSSNKELISESKKLYDKNQDIKFTPLNSD